MRSADGIFPSFFLSKRSKASLNSASFSSVSSSLCRGPRHVQQVRAHVRTPRDPVHAARARTAPVRRLPYAHYGPVVRVLQRSTRAGWGRARSPWFHSRSWTTRGAEPGACRLGAATQEKRLSSTGEKKKSSLGNTPDCRSGLGWCLKTVFAKSQKLPLPNRSRPWCSSSSPRAYQPPAPPLRR